jgi:WD40 repeat protein
MLLLWDLDTGRVRHRFFLAASTIGGVAFSPDGTRLTVAYRPTNGGGEVHIYDVASGATLSRAKLPRLYSVAVSQDGRTVAVSEEELKDKQIRYVLRLYDAATGKRVRLLNRDLGGWADMLTFSADGLILVARMQKPAIRRWDTATGRELGDGPVKVLTSERQIVLSPDGKTGASQLGTAVLLWDLATGKELRRLDTKTAAVGMMGFSPDGKMVITAYHDGMVRLWDAATGQGLRRLIEEHHWFSVGALSPDGKRLACSQHARPPRVWDLTTGQELPPLAGHLTAVKSLLFSPDGKLLASTSETRKHVRLWDVAAGKQRLVISSPEAELTLPAFSPDGKVLAVCRGWQTIVLWDTATGKELRQLQGHKGWIAAVGFLADSKTLVSAGSDGTLRHWDVATGKLRAVRPGIIIRSNELSRPQFMMGQPLETGAYAAAFVAFSPDGSLLASIALEGGDWAVGNATDFYVGGKYVLRVWDTATGTKQY